MGEKKSGRAENSKKQRPGGKSATTTAPTPEETAEKHRRAGVLATSGLLHAAAVMEPLQKNLVGADATADAIFNALETKLDKVRAGNLVPVESMLLSQAMSLQTIYASLARKATSQEYLTQYQAFLTLALKAQAQSRATLEALIELKHPRHPPTVVRQANIAHGPQQVNQHMHTYAHMPFHTGYPLAAGILPEQYAPTGISGTAPNKLLEPTTHETQSHPAPGRAADPVAVLGVGAG